MKPYLQTLIIFGISLNLCACQWSLEPLPSSQLKSHTSGPEVKPLKGFSYSYRGEKQALFTEVWQAEMERSSLKNDEKANTTLKLTLKDYIYESDDGLDLIPGVLAPGLLPFGPLGLWWVYEDLSVDTPSLRVELLAVLSEKSNNSTQPSQLIVGCAVSRGISDEDSLARTAFSLASIKVLEWLENNKK